MTSLLLGLAIAVSAPAPKDGPNQDLPHVGTWSISKIVIGGQELPVPGGTISFEADGKFSSTEPDGKKTKNSGTAKVNMKKTPFEMDIVEKNNGKDKTSRAIFKVEGDVMTICSDLVQDEGERPTKFESSDANRFVLMTLKKVKKD